MVIVSETDAQNFNLSIKDKSKSKASAQKSRNQYFPQGYSENTKLSLQSNTIQSTPQSSLTPVTPIVNDSKSISPYQNFDFGKRKDTDESLKSNYGSYSLNNGQYNQDRSNTSILNKTNDTYMKDKSYNNYDNYDHEMNIKYDNDITDPMRKKIILNADIKPPSYFKLNL